MKKLIIIIALLLAQQAFPQTAYQKAMQQALTTWREGNAEEAMRKMERIAAAEKENWIPKYYQALIATMTSFQTQDVDRKKDLLKVANSLIPQEQANTNAEWYVLKATALSAELVIDPMNNAMRLSPLIIENYENALALEPENPRALYGLASFKIRTKKYMGGNTDQEYKDLQKALSLFDSQSNEIPFYPSWGKQQVEELLTPSSKNK